MEEKAGSDANKLLSEMMGEQGQDALRMLERLERLRRLMGSQTERQEKTGTTAASATLPEKREARPPFGGSVSENMITAAIPFLDQEYQRDLYIIVRLMEMRRVFSGGMLEARGRLSTVAGRAFLPAQAENAAGSAPLPSGGGQEAAGYAD